MYFMKKEFIKFPQKMTVKSIVHYEISSTSQIYILKNMYNPYINLKTFLLKYNMQQ